MRLKIGKKLRTASHKKQPQQPATTQNQKESDCMNIILLSNVAYSDNNLSQHNTEHVKN